MSHETPIGNLSGGISDEDARLVDSILNDINDKPPDRGPPPQRPGPGPGAGPSPEQQKMMAAQKQQMQQQMAMQQQQQIQQQQMAAQQMANQQMGQKKQGNMVSTESSSGDILESIKAESKSIILIIFLSIIFNLDQVNDLFKLQSQFFLNEDGSLNMQTVLIKAILIGGIFFIVKTKLF